MTFDHYDLRSGDTYTIVLLNHEFSYATRYVGFIGGEPIVYDELEEIPEPQRSEIENLIAHKRNE